MLRRPTIACKPPGGPIPPPGGLRLSWGIVGLPPATVAGLVEWEQPRRERRRYRATVYGGGGMTGTPETWATIALAAMNVVQTVALAYIAARYRNGKPAAPEGRRAPKDAVGGPK